MFKNHLEYLRCPKTGSKLTLAIQKEENGQIKTGSLTNADKSETYPIKDYIPRFVPESNYADNFGLEWKTHSRTQYDTTSGVSLSETRFFEATKWPRNLKGEIILECGSGSGRFTEWALSTDATVISLDYSTAVEANFESNGQNPNLLLVQASIYEMPFEKDFADRVFCFGVIQHTPDAKKTFMTLLEPLKPGGDLATDIYRLSLRTSIGTRGLFRIFTSRMEPRKLHKFVHWYVDTMWPLVRLLQKVPNGWGVIFTRKALNIADHSTMGLKGASDEQIKEWAYLNTYDRMSARYENSQTLGTFRRWHEEAGLEDIEVHPGYNGIEGRGRKAALQKSRIIDKKAA
jgi:SAM-dependent methyltransferase